MLSPELIDAYLRDRVETDHLAKSTLRGYREELELLIDRQIPLTQHGLSGFVSAHPSGPPLAPNTRNRRLAILRAFCTWLVAQGHLVENPVMGLKRAKVPQGFSAAIGMSDLNRVLQVLVARPPSWRRTRDLALVLVPFYTGLRVSELHKLTISQVDLPSALLHQATRKGGGATDVLLHACAARVLAA